MLPLVIQLGNIVVGTIVAKEIIKRFKKDQEVKIYKERFKINSYHISITKIIQINNQVKITKKV